MTEVFHSQWYSDALVAQREERYHDALKALEVGAKNDCGMCCWWLGECYWHEIWVGRNDAPVALYWLKKAVSLGNDRARFLIQQWDGFCEDSCSDLYAIALSKYRGTLHGYDLTSLLAAAEHQSDCFVQCKVGLAYHYDEKNHFSLYRKCEWWLRQSAEQGYYLAQYWLAKLVIANEADAILWFRKSALQGYKSAQMDLADMLIRTKNEAGALYWRKLLKYDRCFMYSAREMRIQCRMIFIRIKKCRSSCLTMIAIRKYYPHSALSIFPKDIMILLTKYLWKTWRDEIWFNTQDFVEFLKEKKHTCAWGLVNTTGLVWVEWCLHEPCDNIQSLERFKELRELKVKNK